MSKSLGQQLSPNTEKSPSCLDSLDGRLSAPWDFMIPPAFAFQTNGGERMRNRY